MLHLARHRPANYWHRVATLMRMEKVSRVKLLKSQWFLVMCCKCKARAAARRNTTDQRVKDALLAILLVRMMIGPQAQAIHSTCNPLTILVLPNQRLLGQSGLQSRMPRHRWVGHPLLVPLLGHRLEWSGPNQGARKENSSSTTILAGPMQALTFGRNQTWHWEETRQMRSCKEATLG